jgi:hypothetical protein
MLCGSIEFLTGEPHVFRNSNDGFIASAQLRN